MNPQTKFVTKLFAAIDGYAEIKARGKEDALKLSRAAREIIKPVIEQYNGEWIYENNGKIYTNFYDPEDAVHCAVKIQQLMQNEESMNLRIGLHTGDISSGIGSGDIVAAGIAELAPPGSLCVSEKVLKSFRSSTAPGAVYIDTMKFDSIDRPVKVYVVRIEGSSGPAAKPNKKKRGKKHQPKPSIVVLPFNDMSSGKDQEWFCDGVAEEITYALSHVDGLRVIARTTASVLKRQHLDIKEIGSKLDVDTVLEGSVRKADHRLRITAQLIKVADESHLWSERYDRDMEDVFSVQDEISMAIVEALKVTLLETEKTEVVKHYTNDIEAYELYLKGIYFWNMRKEDGMRKALEYFQLAIDKDASYSLPYVGIADSFNLMGFYGWISPEESHKNAQAALEKALAIDSTLSEAHASLGWMITLHVRDWPQAEKEFKLSLELQSNYATAHEWYAMYLLAMNRFDEAIKEARLARQLDPLSLIINVVVGFSYYCARLYDEALHQFEAILEMDPDFPVTYLFKGHYYTSMGMWDKAIEDREKYADLTNGSQYSLGHLGNTYARAGLIGEAQKTLEQLHFLSKEKYVSPYSFALIHMGLGETDRAFHYFEKAVEERCIHMAYINCIELFDSLRSDSRFSLLLQEIGLPELTDTF